MKMILILLLGAGIGAGAVRGDEAQNAHDNRVRQRRPDLNELQREGGAAIPPSRSATKLLPADGIIYRTVSNQLYNVTRSVIWQELRGNFRSDTTNGLYCFELWPSRVRILLRNYTGPDAPNFSSRAPISVLAMRTEETAPDAEGRALTIWDCGKPYYGSVPGLSVKDGDELAAASREFVALTRQMNDLNARRTRLDDTITLHQSQGLNTAAERARLQQLQLEWQNLRLKLQQAESRKNRLEQRVKP